MSAALDRGEVDAGVGGHLQTLGFPGQVFFGPLGFEEAPGHLTVALVAGAGIASGRDLEGKAVGASARGAISELQLRIFMAAAGADFGSVRIEAMPFPELGPALRSGAIAAASAPDPFAAQLESEGLGRAIDRGSLSRALPAGERALIVGLAATAAWLDRDPAAARALLEATGRAIDDLAADPGLGRSLLPGNARPAVQLPRFDRRLDPADLQRVYDLAFEHGLIADRPVAAGLIVALA
jgi:ABC-type nitrate/sulfonate/bicarbonate transport system substrate-binding protein